MFLLFNRINSCTRSHCGRSIVLCEILHFWHGRGFILFCPTYTVRVPKEKMIRNQWKIIQYSLPLNQLRRFLFNWETPVGYLLGWLTLCAGCAAGAVPTFIFLSLVFGSCWLFIFIAEDITQDVAAFNFTASNENQRELTKRFCDTVQIHSDAKQ